MVTERGAFTADADHKGHRISPHSGIDFYTQTLLAPNGRGDGTVPVSSGSALEVKAEQDRQLDESVLPWRHQDHEGIYNTKPVLTSMSIALDNFAIQLFHDLRA